MPAPTTQTRFFDSDAIAGIAICAGFNNVENATRAHGRLRKKTSRVFYFSVTVTQLDLGAAGVSFM